MGQAIRELRKKLHMTQTELAKQSGVSRATINALENGAAKVAKTSTLQKIAEVLGVEPKDIFLN